MSTIRFTFSTLFILLCSVQLMAQQQMKATRSQVIPWGSPISNIFIDSDNNRWVAHKKGLSKVFGLNLAAEANIDAGQNSLARLKGGNEHIVWDNAALRDLIGDITLQSGIYDALRKELWLGTAESGLFCVKLEPKLQLVEHKTTSNSKLRSNTINDCLIDSRNRLWIATDDGLLLRESGKWTLIEKGLRIEAVANNEEEIWLMGDDLIGKLNSKNTWILIDTPSGKTEGAIKDIDVDAKGQLWIASGIVSMYNPTNDSFSVFGPAQEYTSQFATCIAIDNTGIPWVGTRDKGVYFIQEGAVFAVLSEIVSEADCSNNGTAELIVKVEGADPPFQYNWSGGLQGVNPKNVPPGTYEVTVTDSRGFTSETSVTVADNSLKLSIKQEAQADKDQANGKATVSVEGGKPTYQYKWDNGETIASANNLSPGIHKVTVTDSENCKAIGEIAISESLEKLTLKILEAGEIGCDGETGATVEVAAQGGQAPYQYKWDKAGLSGPKVSGLLAGNYNLTAIDAQGNETNLLVNINARDIMELTINQVGAASVGGNDGQASVQVKKGIVPFTYAWDNGEQTPLAKQLSPGSHTVTVTDAKGCTATASIDIDEDILPLELSLEATNQLNCNTSADGAIQANVRGGKAPYTYKWTGTNATTAKATQLAAQKYELEVIDTEGQSQKAKIELIAPSALELTVSQKSPASTNGSDGVALVEPNGGTSPYSYKWDNDESTAEAKQLTPAKHTVTVTDANGCSTNVSIEITEDILPLQLNLEAITQISCFGTTDGAIEAKVSGGKAPYSYTWKGTDASTASINQLAAQKYELEVRDAEGQSQKAKIELIAPSALELKLSQTSPASTGNEDGIAVANIKGGTAPYNFTWDNGVSTAEAKQLAPGAHSVTVTDANGCSITKNIDISENILPLQLTLEITKEISCNDVTDGQITANIIGGKPPYQYSWTGTEANTAIANELTANDYSLEIIDAAGQKQIAQLTLSAPAPLVTSVSVRSSASTGNADGVAMVEVKGGRAPYTYSWSGGATSEIAEGLSPGIQLVTVSDASGCQANGQVEITENILPLQLAIKEQNPVRCHEEQNGSLIAEVSGGKAPYYYNWSHNSLNSPEAKDLAAGSYSLSITDVTDTEQVMSYELVEPDKLTISATVLASASTNQSDGKARIEVSGGTGTYTYRWKDGNSSAEASNLAPGMHTVVVSDERNCETSVTFEVTEDILPLEVALTLSQALTCANVNNAALEAAVSGGKPPYQYLWEPASLSGSGAYDLGPGEYQLTVTDAIGTEKSASYTISSLTPVLVEINKMIPALTATSEDGQATAVASGGTPPYTFAWDSGANAAKAENLAVGNHRLTVTDGNGCSAEAEVEVVERVMKELASGAIKSGQVINMKKLEFDADSIIIREDAIPIINEVYQFLEDNPSIVVEIGGHTNNLPPPAYCDSLSTNRAREVAEYIVKKGIAPDRVYYKGYGKRKPKYSNGTDDGRRRNQRVEIKILKI